MALNRVVTHLDDTLTAKVADYAAASGVTFDEALASHIVAAHSVFEAVADQANTDFTHVDLGGELVAQNLIPPVL